MCSIIGAYNFKYGLNFVFDSISILKYRGSDNFALKVFFKDGNKLISNFNLDEFRKDFLKSDFTNKYLGELVFGHNLLSIVERVEQPLEDEFGNVLIINGEIYNWKNLDEEFNFNSRNDAELVLNLFKYFEIKSMFDLNSVLSKLEGVYAFAYYSKKLNRVFLSRDLLGVKPLFYVKGFNGEFLFASEKKVFLRFKGEFNLDFEINELNPRNILEYDLSSKSMDFYSRNFFSLKDYYTKSYEDLKNDLKEILFESVRKRIPSKNIKVGLLFSGGIDSTFIALVLKELGVDFICYTAKLAGGNIQEAEDLVYAREIAKKYGFKLKEYSVNLDELEWGIKEVKNIIEDDDYIKVSVALPFYYSCKMAKDDGVRVIFSGLGSEEIFAGYRRHKKSDNPNLECLNGLEILHMRDLYRDDTITMNWGIELRLPFLDYNLIKFSLRIPMKYRLDLDLDRDKIILRDIAMDLGLDIKYANRKKKAAQYGSKFDKGIFNLAKKKNKSRLEFVKSL